MLITLILSLKDFLSILKGVVDSTKKKLANTKIGFGQGSRVSGKYFLLTHFFGLIGRSFLPFIFALIDPPLPLAFSVRSCVCLSISLFVRSLVHPFVLFLSQSMSKLVKV